MLLWPIGPILHGEEHLTNNNKSYICVDDYLLLTIFTMFWGFGLTHLVWFNTKSRSRGFAWYQSSEIEINVKQIYLTSSNTRWVGPLILMHDTICFSLDYCVTVLQKWYRRFISEAWHVHVLLAWSFWQNSSLGCLTRA